MGWKLFTILYKAKNSSEANLLKRIENSKSGIEYLKIGKTTFSECMYPKEGFLYIGKYKDYLIVNELNMSHDFFQESSSRFERFWRTQSRDNQDVYCFILHSVSCMYGISYISNQRKVRCKYGYLDEPILIDIGEPLDFEKEYYKKNNIDALIEDGELEFHQIGEDLVFFGMEKILGARPDLRSDFMDLEMTIYKEDIVDDFDVMSGINTS